jgi:Acyclic terpene utilisation family protein AtuA
MKRPVRIANTSAFYGDRLAAMRWLLDSAEVDVITGDYLAELTMLILWKAKQKDPESGYARTFLTQFAQVVTDCAARGVKVITNAGGLNPAGLAEAVRAIIAEAGVSLSVAHVDGDDLIPQLATLRAAGVPFTHLDTGADLAECGAEPVSANAYLGGWGIATAMAGGADIVITGRVTDAALVVGAGAWWHEWSRTDFDALAGAVAAGHIIECGPQATGGNYSHLAEIADRRYPGSPIAELAHDGSFVITKPDDTGGLVSPGTVIAQLLYEVGAPAYVNPDVVAHFDTLTVEQDGPDRVRVSGTKGGPPPPTLKVAMNYIGGYRNTMTMVLTGLNIEDKATWAIDELFDILGGQSAFDDVDVQLLRYDCPIRPRWSTPPRTCASPSRTATGQRWTAPSRTPSSNWPSPGIPAFTPPRHQRRRASSGATGPPWCPPNSSTTPWCMPMAAPKPSRTALKSARRSTGRSGGRNRSAAISDRPPAAHWAAWSPPARATRAATPTSDCGQTPTSGGSGYSRS